MDNNHLDPREIETDIEITRRQISNTLEEIQDQLSPNQLLNHTFEYISDKLIENKNFPTSLTDTARENPMATTLIGFGLGLLVLSKKNKANNTNTARKYKKNDATETTNVTGKNKDSLDDDTNEKMEQPDNDQAEHALDKLHEQPLVLIGAGLTLGTVLGIYLNSLQNDNKLLKKGLDKKIDRVMETGNEHLGKVKEAVISAVETINEAVDEVSNTSGACEDNNNKNS